MNVSFVREIPDHHLNKTGEDNFTGAFDWNTFGQQQVCKQRATHVQYVNDDKR
jgi:hypothetical protein